MEALEFLLSYPYLFKKKFFSTGRDKYFLLPKQGTNLRGVEFSKAAMLSLVSHPNTVKIEIPWIKPTDKYNQYKRWLDYWA